MSDTAILINTGVAIVAIVVLIVRFKLNPLIALVIGCLYLGLAAGLGVGKTVDAIGKGFGDIMADIGLLIAFGVLMGAILRDLRAIERLVDRLLHVVGPKRIPHAMALTIATFLQSIYLDVLLVISAPLAKSIAPRLGRFGTARMATALAIGLECGIIFTVPGVGALALAGLLHVPLGTYLLYGLIVVIPTVAIAITITTFLLTHGWWKPAMDEQDLNAQPDPAGTHPTDGTDPTGSARSTSAAAAASGNSPQAHPAVGNRVVAASANSDAATTEPISTAAKGRPAGAVESAGRLATTTETRPASAAVATEVDPTQTTTNRPQPRLLILFTPLIVALLLVATGAIAEMAHWSNPVVALLSSPLVALLIGLVGTCLLGRWYAGQPQVEESLAAGLRQSGQILLLSGVGGSLASVIEAAGLGDILGKYLSASTFAPLLVVWAIAALLHVAVGSVTISAITAAGLLAPVAPALGLNPVLIALAAGAGSLFLVHLTSNTFWLLQALMGQTTRGTLKTCSVGVSIASVVAMGPILALSLVL